MKEIEEKYMIDGNVVSIEDINTIRDLEKRYLKEREKIADECEKEGYPRYGSNYVLRCECLRGKVYDTIDFILSKYETSTNKLPFF